MDEALRLQKERERIHRWRASKRQAGNDMLTIWLPRELKLYIEDMALKRHCSPSAWSSRPSRPATPSAQMLPLLLPIRMLLICHRYGSCSSKSYGPSLAISICPRG